MVRQQTIRARDKLVGKMPISGELLRGTLLERTVRHKSGCPKCARGEGHQVFVLKSSLSLASSGAWRTARPMYSATPLALSAKDAEVCAVVAAATKHPLRDAVPWPVQFFTYPDKCTQGKTDRSWPLPNKIG
jgi:hypothetical protein